MEGEGTLSVAVRRPTRGQAEVSFADTGPGISPENLEKVFQPLFTTKTKGFGFGLATAKIIVEKHGGTVDVRSEPGKGTVFSIRLPVARSSDE